MLLSVQQAVDEYRVATEGCCAGLVEVFEMLAVKQVHAGWAAASTRGWPLQVMLTRGGRMICPNDDIQPIPQQSVRLNITRPVEDSVRFLTNISVTTTKWIQTRASEQERPT